MSQSVFARYESQLYPYLYAGTLFVPRLAGGTPTDPRKAEGWLRSRFEDSTDDQIERMVAEVMADRLVQGESATREDAVEQVLNTRHLNGFKRTGDGELYIEGRQLKAAIKEAGNIRWPKRRWGQSNKGTRGFFAEHLFVIEHILGLGVKEPTRIEQRFPHTWKGSGIQYEEIVEDAKIHFTLETDVDFAKEVKKDGDFQNEGEFWAALWTTGERQGIGATRSQGFGMYSVIRWERIGR